MHSGRYYLIIKILVFKQIKLNFKLKTPNILNKVRLFVVYKGGSPQTIIIFCHRVLHVGGTIVLLLSGDHLRRLKGCEESSVSLCPKGSRTDEPGSEECLNPEEKAAVPEPAWSSLEASNQEHLDRMPPFGSLVPVECYKVSLGKPDAFIYKYKKSHSPGQQQVCRIQVLICQRYSLEEGGLWDLDSARGLQVNRPRSSQVREYVHYQNF